MEFTSIPTLVDLLSHRALTQPQDTAFVFLDDGEREAARLTFEELEVRARAIGAELRDRMNPGDRALMLYPPGLDFICGFFGCLYAGVVAVPAQLPGPNRKTDRLDTIVADASVGAILTTDAQLIRISAGLGSVFSGVEWMATDAIPVDRASRWQRPEIGGETLAILQYTSGSTSAPKGVMVSHRNFLHTSLELDVAWHHTRDSVMVTWLPTFHDLGLVYGVLQPVYRGFPCYMMSPAAFLVRPYRWLHAVSRFRATHTCSPNFAFDLCVDKITAEQRATLDLTSWQVALNGAEPVREPTIDRFAAAFTECGFDPATMCPSYGLAEATLKVATPPKKSGPFRLHVDPVAFAANRIVERAPEQGGQTVIACGRTETDTRIAIANPDTLTRCSADEVGEIWVSGRSVAQGYWQQPDLTRQTFHARLADTGEGPFLRTGDLGFVHGGQLFITGRIKDLIIVHGINHYPQDIEYTVEECHPAARKAGSAAFSVEVAGEERLVIAQEIERTSLRNLNSSDVIAAIRQTISEKHDLQTYAILLLKPGSLPKTSSGKIQRQMCRALYREDRLASIAEWHQTLAAAPPTVDPRDVESCIVRSVARSLRLAVEEIDVHEPFARYGMESVAAAALAADLAEFLGRPVLPTVVFDYPTVDSLGRHLSGQRAEASPDPAPPAPDAIAIVGIGCRFPGARNPAAFWRLLRDGVDAIGETPVSRWDADAFYHPEPATPGKTRTRHGAFLDGDVAGFDADFFGVSPKEADAMDPQQRLLLEVAWEAVEDTGLRVDRLAGTRTGVFIGISTNDYATLHRSHASDLSAYAGTGTSLSIAANRLSYVFDFRGPSMAVDTACSSSLVAVHLACQSLLRGECDVALAGGVNVMLAPDLTITFSQARMLSPDGRCKAFDADADGYGRGEGCGVVVLQRLSDALRRGARILAVIRGTAINQDGRSNGLTAPNGPAQQDVVRQALQAAGAAPGDIAYVEAHGSGTPLGDPIELNALKEALAPGRSQDRPFLVGSVKTNIGHLEAAAGIAGLIKVALSLYHRKIPAHLHLRRPNPHIAANGAPYRIPIRCEDWPRGARRLAGVSAFGFGGANAHAIVEEPPERQLADPVPVRPFALLTLSAKREDALDRLRSSYEAHLRSESGVSLPDFARTANTARPHFEHRLAIVANCMENAAAQLSTPGGDQSVAGSLRGTASPREGRKIAFLFTGQGSQYIGMGRELHDTNPLFRQSLESCAELLRDDLPKYLLDVMFSGDNRRSLDETAYTQPALFALEYSLARLWMSWGIEPTAMLGHSVGEYVAACLAGVFSLRDGLRLIASRGRLMQSLPHDGAMAMVAGPQDRVAAAIAGLSDDVSIAAINGPRNTVISGRRGTVDAVTSAFLREGVRCVPLTVSHAFHSPLMQPMVDQFAAAVGGVDLAPPNRLLISNVTGAADSTRMASVEYWTDHIRLPVRFSAGMDALERLGCHAFVEIGPQPHLTSMARQFMTNREHAWLPSLQQGNSDWQQLMTSLGNLYVRGASVDWEAFDEPFSRTRVDLPSYPFHRQRHWIAPATVERDTLPAPSGLFHGIEWQEARPVSSHHANTLRRWRILHDRQGVARSVAARLQTLGHQIVEDGDTDASVGVLDFRALDLSVPEIADPTLGCAALLESIQRWIAAGAAPRCWCFTRGAVAAGNDRGIVNVAQTAAWGWNRVVRLEHPEIFGGIVDLPIDVPTDDLGDLVADALSSGLSEIAIRDRALHVPRLERVRPSQSESTPLVSDGSYLITGGLGALGLQVAEWLAAHGAGRIVLCGRHTTSSRPDLPGDVRIVRADVSIPQDVRRLIAEIDATMAPLKGIFHAAGVIDDGILLRLTPERIARVMAPKVNGAWHLHQETKKLDLDFFVMFSSAASLLGSRGQASYAAANAFMDGLAHYRRAAGLPALSINWGPWAGAGIAANFGARSGGHLDREKVRPIEPREALGALRSLLHSERAQVAVISLASPPLEKRNDPPAQAGSNGLLADRLRRALPAERTRMLEAHLQDEVAAVLGMTGSAPDRSRGFFEMGMDSLMALDLRNRLADGLGLKLPATTIFEHPTIERAGRFLLQAIGLESSATEAARPRGPVATEPIAIVGIGCRFPGQANDPAAFWRLLADGVDAVGKIPADRWNRDAYYNANPDVPGSISTRHGAFLDRIDQFDAEFFGISPREAESMDPQQRLLLMVAWEALENAGIAPGSLLESSTGVFVGIGQNDYARLRLTGGRPADITAYDGTGNGFCFASGRLSYSLGLRGPNLSVDTACSASLVSVHLACQSLRMGECELALAGGVQLIVSPEVTIFLSRTGALSPDGRCKAFDASADGYGRGEGCGLVVLKRLSDAIAANDRIYAVIRGSAVNHGGSSGGLTVPSESAQEQLMRTALAAAGASAAELDYLEAHGTGTVLGDPIELRAVNAVYGRERLSEAPLRVASVKSNIGHLEAAAGVAGLIKVALALNHEEIPPHLHFTSPNPHINWCEMPIRIATEREEWTRGIRTRTAAVSAFGISGTNAHVVLEEAPLPAPAIEHREGSSHLLVLSAKTPDSLSELAARFSQHFRDHPEAGIGATCYTAAVGRTHFRYRWAGIASNIPEMVALLRSAAASDPGERPPRVVFAFTTNGHESKIEAEVLQRCGLAPAATIGEPPDGYRDVRSIARPEHDDLVITIDGMANDETASLNRLANAYRRGIEVDWHAFYRGRHQPRVNLPTYPFQTRRFWIDSTRSAAPAVPGKLYDIVWRPVPPPPPASKSSAGAPYVILCDRSGTGAATGQALLDRGYATVLREPGWKPEAGGRYREIIDFSSLDWNRVEDAALLSEQMVDLLRTADARVRVITRNAVPAGSGRSPLSLVAAPLWGLGRVAALECPDKWAGMIDLPDDMTHESMEVLVSHVVAGDGEDQVAIRGTERFVARLTEGLPSPAPPLRIDADDSFLVIGGWGALGLAVARWLVSQGARHLVLTGRTSPSEHAAGAVSTLERTGASIAVVQADAGDAEQMQRVLSHPAFARHPLKGVVHAAGVPGVTPLAQLDRPLIESAFRAKVAGASIVDVLTRRLDLKMFVCFSSIASVWGSRGQGHYAAANHFLDMLAHDRRRAGLPALTINWGPWTGGGMVSVEDARTLARIGIRPFTPAQGLDALGYLLNTDAAQIAVADVDWQSLKDALEWSGHRRFLEDIDAGPGGSRGSGATIVSVLEQSRPKDRLEILRGFVNDEVARLLGLDPATASLSGRGFFSLGMDSIMAVELRKSLELSLDRSLPSTIAFDYPDVDALAGYLAGLLDIVPAAKATAARTEPGDAPLRDEEIGPSLLKQLERVEALVKGSRG
jgi:acyl transferase domain-containing protein/acyl-CoA synthetase (AMP-forming)/AMP-acid ligase II/acyl carrier protein